MPFAIKYYLAFARTVSPRKASSYGQVAQLVEQRTENPRAEGSSPPLTTINNREPSGSRFVFSEALGVCEVSCDVACMASSDVRVLVSFAL